MNEYRLSKRLQRVGELVPKDSHLADIGSDHAYLPVYLVNGKKIPLAIAGEVVEGPYKAAKKQVKKNKLQSKIIVRLANGLEAVEKEDNISAITICGMGGLLIRDILENGWQKQKILGNETLILQPNVGEKVVREWLTARGYLIHYEDILEENQKIYEIIVASRGATRCAYTSKEQRFGPMLLQKRSVLFRKKWQKELAQKQQILIHLARAKQKPFEKINQIQEEIAGIKEVLLP